MEVGLDTVELFGREGALFACGVEDVPPGRQGVETEEAWILGVRDRNIL